MPKKEFRIYINSNNVTFQTDNATVAKKIYNKYATVPGIKIVLCSSTVEIIPKFHMVFNTGDNSTTHLRIK